MLKKKKGFGFGDIAKLSSGVSSSMNKGVKKVMTPSKPGGWADDIRRRRKRGKLL